MATLTLLYGIQAGETERYMETLLTTNSAAIETVKAMAAADGFHSFRTATHTDGDRPNFAATLATR